MHHCCKTHFLKGEAGTISGEFMTALSYGGVGRTQMETNPEHWQRKSIDFNKNTGDSIKG